MIRYIVNADDFGANPEINNAVMALMDLNLCRDTTLFANFEASPDAANLAIKSQREKDIGIHLNLSAGVPITKGIKKESRFCNSEGSFHFKRDKRTLFLSKSEKRAVYEELSGQISLVRKLGIPISHADSHNHVHEEPGLFKVILDLVKAEGIPYLRPLRNFTKTSLPNFVYRKASNYYLSIRNLSGVQYFGNINDFIIKSKDKIKPGSTCEVMIHPGRISGDQIYDFITSDNLTLELPKIINETNLSSYNQLL